MHLFGEVVLPVCSPRLLRDSARPRRTPDDLRHHCLLQQRKLVAPFKKSLVSPHSYFLFQSDASRRKPEVGGFLVWLQAEALAAQ